MLNYRKPATFTTATAIVSAKENEAVNNNFIVYPNPAKDIVHVQSAGKATFVLTNQSGKTILTKTLNGNGQINVTHLPAGVYYLQNMTAGAKQKVIIQ